MVGGQRGEEEEEEEGPGNMKNVAFIFSQLHDF